MNKTDEIKFLNYLQSLVLVYDSKRSSSFIQDIKNYRNGIFFREIDDPDTNEFINNLSYEKYGVCLSELHLKRINRLLQYHAKNKGEKCTVNYRVAKSGQVICVNLGSGQLVKVTRNKAFISNKAKAKFGVYSSLAEMPIPDFENGNIKLLRRYIPVKSSLFKLILVFIFNCFITDTHYVMLVLSGPAGSAKSFITKVLKTIIDPSEAALLDQITNTADLAVAADHSHLITMNNVTSISNQIQDALCTTLTGGARAVRRFHTNKGQSVTHSHNPVILNGIGEVITRDDALERSLLIRLKKITDTDVTQVSERQLTEDFIKDLPIILGGIFNALSKVLKTYEGFEIPGKLNRMADFHILGCVTEKALGWQPGSFTKAYNANIADAQSSVLEGSSTAQAIIKLGASVSDFVGTLGELEAKLTNYCSLGNSNPRKLGAEIDRLAPSLLNVHDIKINRISRSGKGNRLEITFP